MPKHEQHGPMDSPILWYFADPMCSWCWGFTPAIEAVRERYRDRVRIALVLGGLRPGETAPMAPQAREEILHHWHAVHERTGQPFRFEGALPDGFVYDTEPACRAVVSAGRLDATLTFPMFRSIQEAFYVGGRDVTRAETLADLAAGLGLDAGAFADAFRSEAAHAQTEAHFRQARRAGITGFPALILQQDAQLHGISAGCLPLETVCAALDAHLAA